MKQSCFLISSRTNDVIQQFAEWLSQSSLSVLIQTHYAWVIPTIQSIHIVGIGVVLASVLAIDLRVLGWAGHDQSLSSGCFRWKVPRKPAEKALR